ncbi:hypothetical protein BHM03_00035268 [Ensete ventricosum]|nr:hypothetical protein BHM03_00035268 [Ensete ventricosum]
MIPTDLRAFKALEIMKSCHDFDSTVSVESLVVIQERYSILSEYALQAPLPGQHPYNTHSDGFSISVDALKARLRFPLHLVIGEYLDWWQISPNQMAQHYYMALADHVHDAGRVIDIMDNKAEGLRKEIEDLKVEHEEVTHRRESLELELNDSHLFLADSQEQLEDVRAQGQVMEDELLNLTCSMEGLKVKLPQKAIVEYKESPNFQMGLVRTR